MDTSRRTHGWSGSVRTFLDQPKSLVESKLQEHLLGLLGMNPSNSQFEAWIEEIDVLRQSLRDLAIARMDCLEWSLILEFELPLEGGRRPDVIILGPGRIFVLEFKQDHHLIKLQHMLAIYPSITQSLMGSKLYPFWFQLKRRINLNYETLS